ncbi:DUF484 family protein [uncultured Parasphingopyxis sp.]|uniref:DUF484 family protein n=1 Tax=uncultured Parasphingopyxis sp. TaxID=1547918 RepID=UPI00262EB300|nr:DUF484 family protein [uncultured Parasphingopyxis sp.]
MGTVIDFESGAVARLQRRIAETEAERADLLAFGQGHWTATRSVHEAVLAVIASEHFDSLLRIVTEKWPAILGCDAVALAFVSGKTGFRADDSGMHGVEARLVESLYAERHHTVLRSVDAGHPLFGPRAADLHAEAIIPLHETGTLQSGLLLLGQWQGEAEATPQGTELLDFLGDSLAAMIGRWLPR